MEASDQLHSSHTKGPATMADPNQQAVGQKRLRPKDEELGNGVQPPLAKHKRPDEEDATEHKSLCDALRQHQRELIETEAVRDSAVMELVYLRQGGNVIDFKATTQLLQHSKKVLAGTAPLMPPHQVQHKPKKLKKAATAPTVSISRVEQAAPLPVPLVAKTPRPSPTAEEEISAKAKKDAETIRRIQELQKEGLWGPQRMPKIPEPPRIKSTWDHILTGVAWLAEDFKGERMSKRKLARNLSKEVRKQFRKKEQAAKREDKNKEKQIRRRASAISRQVKAVWKQVEELVFYKHSVKLQVKVQEARDKQLDFLVGQTEKLSNIIAKDIKQPSRASDIATASSTTASATGTIAPATSVSEPVTGSTAPAAPAGSAPSTTDGQGAPPAAPSGQPVAASAATPVVPPPAADPAVSEPTPMDVDGEGADDETRKDIITQAAANANRAQPTGTTLQTTSVKTPVPFLLKHSLREYQHIGLDWLVSMYDAKLNGILADEMGLGKTIQTISLLAYLACERGIWGPHLLVVPTSVMLNWERELKKWCPAFKVVTYYGSQKERKQKRKGWTKPNAFHVCITSYKIATQDKNSLIRHRWQYLILDEAQNIKNFRSQRWQSLLTFSTKRRLLLTGTPLQNNLMELWSLMHFLMPHIFQSHSEFRDWFCNPVNSMIEGTTAVNQELISRLHGVLRPFLLRRLKKDVETQLPGKFEHIILCPLSKRQRFLYDEFISRGDTLSDMESGSYFSMLNVLMQLRKVCNHPDLFEVRPIHSSFFQHPLEHSTSSLVYNCLDTSDEPLEHIDLNFLGLRFLETPGVRGTEMRSCQLDSQRSLQAASLTELGGVEVLRVPQGPPSALLIYQERQAKRDMEEELECRKHQLYINRNRCSSPAFATAEDLLRAVRFRRYPENAVDCQTAGQLLERSTALAAATLTMEQRIQACMPLIVKFTCVIPPVTCGAVRLHCSHPDPLLRELATRRASKLRRVVHPLLAKLRPAIARQRLSFPEERLLQYDCGKLQKLALLLRKLKAGGHRVLIFTQMTRMLDVLEKFLNLHGYMYSRLDGTTKPERRQMLMERFNADDRVFAFILSTRSGGFGINLIGADTVVFYDSDWNPAMDAQAQDRCHRIGQTREVHIYRLISENTVEENILKKANQKRMLDRVAIDGGQFTTEFFQQVDIHSLVEGDGSAISKEEVRKAMLAAEDETDVAAMVQAQKELAEDPDQEEFLDAATPLNTSMAATAAAVEQQEGDFMEELKPVQKYMYRFLEDVVQVVDHERLDAMHTQVDLDTQAWQENTRRRIEQKARQASMEDEPSHYEVTRSSLKEYKGMIQEDMQLFGLQLEQPGALYVHPFDYETVPSDVSLFSKYPNIVNQYSRTSALIRKKKQKQLMKERQKELLAIRKEKKRQEMLLRQQSPNTPRRLGRPKKLQPMDEAYEEQPIRLKIKRQRSAERSDSSTKRRKAEDMKVEPRKFKKADIPVTAGGLFGPRYMRKNNQARTTRKPKPANDNGKPANTQVWSPAEDAAIMSSLDAFGHNWELVGDQLNSFPFSQTRKRSKRQCHDYYRLRLAPLPKQKQKDDTVVPPPTDFPLPPSEESLLDTLVAPGAEPEPVSVIVGLMSNPAAMKRMQRLAQCPTQADTAVVTHVSHAQVAKEAAAAGKTPAEIIVANAARALAEQAKPPAGSQAPNRPIARQPQLLSSHTSLGLSHSTPSLSGRSSAHYGVLRQPVHKGSAPQMQPGRVVNRLFPTQAQGSTQPAVMGMQPGLTRSLEQMPAGSGQPSSPLFAAARTPLPHAYQAQPGTAPGRGVLFQQLRRPGELQPTIQAYPGQPVHYAQMQQAQKQQQAQQKQPTPQQKAQAQQKPSALAQQQLAMRQKEQQPATAGQQAQATQATQPQQRQTAQQAMGQQTMGQQQLAALRQKEQQRQTQYQRHFAQTGQQARATTAAGVLSQVQMQQTLLQRPQATHSMRTAAYAQQSALKAAQAPASSAAAAKASAPASASATTLSGTRTYTRQARPAGRPEAAATSQRQSIAVASAPVIPVPSVSSTPSALASGPRPPSTTRSLAAGLSSSSAPQAATPVQASAPPAQIPAPTAAAVTAAPAVKTPAVASAPAASAAAGRPATASAPAPASATTTVSTSVSRAVSPTPPERSRRAAAASAQSALRKQLGGSSSRSRSPSNTGASPAPKARGASPSPSVAPAAPAAAPAAVAPATGAAAAVADNSAAEAVEEEPKGRRSTRQTRSRVLRSSKK